MNRRTIIGALISVAIPAALASQNPPPPPPVTPPVVVTPGQQTPAQAATGKPVTNEQISTAIKNSGLTQQQLQQRLQQAGYEPSLASPFFGANAAGGAGAAGASGAAAGTSAGSADFTQALQALGILSIPTNSGKPEEVTKQPGDSSTARFGGVFGKDIFARSTSVFDPVTAGPVDPGYHLGVGDALQVVVTGQVELAYAPEVRRDGTVIIPQVGQISLAGLTLDVARTVLKERMARSYSGLNTGEARLDLSIARIRSNAVFVIGEVETPGAYQVNALATVFHAIARAGGPSDRGSFRNIEVRRGNRVIQRLDLYDYLLKGNAEGDIRLEQGDVIFVPLNLRVVAVMGQVRRPRIFELRETEGFTDLLRFAGELLPSASVERVQIDRILPPERRAPGLERVKVDVEIKGRLDSLARVRLLDGDMVEVFSIGDIRRNVVSIVGQVFQVGEFELRPAMTLSKLIAEAQGLMPWALGDRIKVIRQLPLTGRSIVFSKDISAPDGRDFLIEEFDAVEVLDSRVGFPGGTITIEGAINAPAARGFVERETLRDVIERSGGVKEEAQKVEVYRRRVGATYSDTTSTRYSFDIGRNFTRDTTLRGFMLERDDRVVVLSSPGFRPQQFVSVSGQFKYPGTYAITENRDRVSDLVRLAGDLLPGAYTETFRLLRAGLPVSVDFDRAMRGDVMMNIPLLGNDQLIIDRDPTTVLITGAVNRTSLIRYQRELSLEDYVELAGGPTERGDKLKAVVQYPSGFSRRVKKVAFFFHTLPDIVSGAIITVPEKPTETKTSTTEIWQQILGSATAILSIAAAYAAVIR